MKWIVKVNPVNDGKIFSPAPLIHTVILLAWPASASMTIPLVWDPSANSNVAGYKIYYGVVSHVYTDSVDVGNVTNAIITGLSASTTYYFAATTYDASGYESGFSNETITTVPNSPASLTAAFLVDGQFALSVSGVTNHPCVVQASTNLVDWVAVQTNTVPFTFVDSNASQFGQHFYRAVNLP
jgi:hypothetical protein